MIPENIRIPGVSVVKKPGSHDDDRRTIVVITNSEPDDISVGQTKALVLKKDAWLGGEKGHFHTYPEMYTALNGSLAFYLQHTEHPELRQLIALETGERLTIPPHVAHKVFALRGTIFVGITAQPYIGPEQDIPYPVETSTKDA